MVSSFLFSYPIVILILTSIAPWLPITNRKNFSSTTNLPLLRLSPLHLIQTLLHAVTAKESNSNKNQNLPKLLNNAEAAAIYNFQHPSPLERRGQYQAFFPVRSSDQKLAKCHKLRSRSPPRSPPRSPLRSLPGRLHQGRLSHQRQRKRRVDGRLEVRLVTIIITIRPY